MILVEIVLAFAYTPIFSLDWLLIMLRPIWAHNGNELNNGYL